MLAPLSTHSISIVMCNMRTTSNHNINELLSYHLPIDIFDIVSTLICTVIGVWYVVILQFCSTFQFVQLIWATFFFISHNFDVAAQWNMAWLNFTSYSINRVASGILQLRDNRDVVTNETFEISLASERLSVCVREMGMICILWSVCLHFVNEDNVLCWS